MKNKTRPQTKKYLNWCKSVLEKDFYTCQQCGSKDKLICHHIIKWDEKEELRYDVLNGLTLCRSCHMKHHYENAKKRFKKGIIPWNKGLKGLKIGTKKGTKFTKEHKEKLSIAKKGKSSWNKGIPMREETKKKQRNRFLGKSWKIDPASGKRMWVDFK